MAAQRILITVCTIQEQTNTAVPIENRARFPLMVIDRIRKLLGQTSPLRSVSQVMRSWKAVYGLDDAIEFAKMLDGKVDLIHVSATSFRDVNSGCRMFPSAFLPHGVNVYLAEASRSM